MTHFTKCIRTNENWQRLEWTQYKQRNMYISEPFYTQDNCYHIVMSYDTIIGFINDVDSTFITWGYSEYSCTTSKQITQLCNEGGYRMKKVSKYTYDDIDMLERYLDLYADIVG